MLPITCSIYTPDNYPVNDAVFAAIVAHYNATCDQPGYYASAYASGDCVTYCEFSEPGDIFAELSGGEQYNIGYIPYNHHISGKPSFAVFTSY